MTGDDRLADQLAADYESAPITEADKAMLRYADKLTRTPSKMTQGDVDVLRAAGFSAAAVLDTCMITGYYAFVNRLAGGLGVELEHQE